MSLHEAFTFKRIASFLLALVLVLGILPVSPHVHAAEGDDLNYTLVFATKYCGSATNEGHLDITKNDDNHAKGKKLSVTATVADGSGTKVDTDAWIGVFRGKYALDSDFSDAECLFDYTVAGKTSGGTAYNGGAIPIGNKNILLIADDYSIVLFKDASTDNPARVITFAITWDNITETVTKEATCTEDGMKHQVYVGAYSNKAETTQWEYDVVIPALGHEITVWTEVPGTDTHSAVCGRSSCGQTVTENCTFDSDHVCTVCGGAEETAVEEPEENVVLTNMAGEKADTFTSGEPIYVETNGYTSAQWLDLWYVKPEGGYESTYRLWWYASDEKMLLWDGEWNDSTAWDGMNMPAGTYEIYLESTTLLKTFTMVDPDETVAAEKSLAVTVDGKKVFIDAINYSEYSQVSVTNASGVEVYQFFCPGRNGLTMECELIPGEYTVSMYNDYYKSELHEQQTFTIQGEEVALLTTDKTEYKWGEPIMVTSQMGDPCWIGLYKQSDANPTTEGPVSLFWVYPPVGEAVNLIIYDNQQRHSEWVADTYKVLLLDANYSILASVENIVITTELDVSKTQVTPATCEKDGLEKYFNTDGTSAGEKVLPALNHDYATLKPEYNPDNGQHTFVCNNDINHKKIENCSWDEGVVTKEPTAEEDGVMTYTCSVCSGTRTEKISSKTVDHEEITLQPTCEEPGKKTVYYTDGTSDEVEIPKLNHAYPETFTYNNDQKTHSRICTNDEKHVETADCSFVGSPVSGGTRYTCSVCGGYYDVIILSTNKTEYALGEKILVSVDTSVYDETSLDWVGIWENDLTYSDNVSLYYYYPASQGYSDFDIEKSQYWQRGSITQGEYTIRLFTNDSYTEIVSLKIKVGPAVRDESKTVRIEPTCETDGSITYYLTNGQVEKVVTAAEDETLKALNHSWSDWAQIEGTETHTRTCANDATHVETQDCDWDEGTETKAPSYDENGLMVYTCGTCGGTKEETLPKLDAVETGREVVAPDCMNGGYTIVTYSDGSTKKIDSVSALGHSFGDYQRIEGTHTHTQTCQRANCGFSETVDCALETNGVLNGNTYSYACTKCGAWEEPVIITDKTVYASGEDIIITLHPNYAKTMGSTDWIGLYKKGETPSSTGVTSIRWNYVGDFVDGMSIFNSSNHDRPNEDIDNHLIAGEYALFLCANDGYTVNARTYFTVTTELDESKTVRTEPTCTEDGQITYYNTDGTVNKIVTADDDETLKATGHSHGDWSYDGVRVQTHTRTCACGDTETQACLWNEGVVTTEPTYTDDGVKTYTCTICGGEKTEVVPKLSVTVTGTDRKEPTCEEPGMIRTHYSDGTHSDEVIPAKGHAYGGWTVDEGGKTHSKTCANDASHVITEDCIITSTVNGDKVSHTCSVCGRAYTTGLIETDKLVYGVTDPIMVTAHTTFGGAWVGLYKEGELFDPNNGGVASLFWSYISEDMVGKAFDLTAVTAGTTSGLRGETLSNGKYVLCFFGDSGYSNVISTVELEVFTDMSNTKFELLFYKALPREDGYHKSFKLAEVDNPNKGEKVTLGVNVLEGEVGNSMVAVFQGKYDLTTDYTRMSPIITKNVADTNGGKTFTMNWPSKGGFDFYVGEFTIVVFTDSSKETPVRYVTFDVYRPIASEEILREPTCDSEGLKSVIYEDDGNDATSEEDFLPIPALGHAYSEWTCVEGTNTHVRTCGRETCGNIEKQNCTFVNDACTVCGGKEYHIHATTKVAAADATCTENGNIEYYTCECGKWFTDENATQEIADKNSVVIEKKGHSWVDASCTAPKTCSVCGAIEGEKAGHSWQAATCSTPKLCTVCNATEGNALGHAYGTWTYDEATKSHSKVCSNDETHVLNEKCVFGDAEITKQPIGNNPGEKKYTCTICGGSYTEEFTAAADGTFDRTYGSDRYETSFAVANQLKKNQGVEKFGTIVVASGTDFADALSGNYLANQKNAPILLVRNREGEMNTVKNYIKANLVTGGTVYILGGENAVPKAMETGLDGFKVVRLGGATRYETNIAILKEAGVKAGDDLLVCTGKDFADCLSASAVNKPVLMVKDSLYAVQSEYLNAIKGGKLYIIGGKAAVTEKLENTLSQYGTTERISGATRYETSVSIAQKFFPGTKFAVLVYGMNFPDGLCGGSLANGMNAPVILVTSGKQAVAANYAKDNGITSGVVLGGPKLITDEIAKTIFDHT